jgi:hypothetical protein
MAGKFSTALHNAVPDLAAKAGGVGYNEKLSIILHKKMVKNAELADTIHNNIKHNITRLHEVSEGFQMQLEGYPIGREVNRITDTANEIAKLYERMERYTSEIIDTLWALYAEDTVKAFYAGIGFTGTNV